jgi:hypothetical protein
MKMLIRNFKERKSPKNEKRPISPLIKKYKREKWIYEFKSEHLTRTNLLVIIVMVLLCVFTTLAASLIKITETIYPKECSTNKFATVVNFLSVIVFSYGPFTLIAMWIVKVFSKIPEFDYNEPAIDFKNVTVDDLQHMYYHDRERVINMINVDLGIEKSEFRLYLIMDNMYFTASQNVAVCTEPLQYKVNVFTDDSIETMIIERKPDTNVYSVVKQIVEKEREVAEIKSQKMFEN